MTMTTSSPRMSSITPLVTIIANPAISLADFDALPHASPAGTGPGGGAPGGSGGSGGFLSRDHIIQATEACFAVAGYDGTTIRAIAGRLGCAVGSIYRYFGDKRSLLLAVASRMFDPLVEDLNHRTRPVTFDQSLAAYLDAAIAQPDRYRLLMWLSGAAGSGGPSLLPHVLDHVISGWARLLGSREQAQSVWATVHGTLSLGCEPRQIIATVNGMIDIAAESTRGLPPAAEKPQDEAPAAGYTAAAFEVEDVTLL